MWPTASEKQHEISIPKMASEQYWLATFEQDRGLNSYRQTEAYDQHPADFLVEWNKDKSESWFPICLIFAMPITKEQYDNLNA